MAEAFEEKLGNLLKARFPFICIRSWEEERALTMLRTVAGNPNRVRTPRKVFVWNVVQGLTGEGMTSRPDLQDPMKLLAWLETVDEPAVYVIKDFNAFCGIDGEGKTADPRVVRRLKHLSDSLHQSQSPRTIVFLAGNPQIPPLLEREVHILDLHMPTAEEIRTVLHQMIESNRASGRIAFNLNAAEEEELVKAALGLTLREAENAFAYAMVHDGQLSVADIQVILEEKCQVLRKTDLLEFIHTPIQIGDVGGLENLKRWLAKRKNAWLDAAARYGLPAPRGILLTGVPGCGKSLVAKAIGSAWQLPLLRLDPGRIYGGLMGSSEENIRKVIKITEAIAPCILWIDEIEKGFSTGSGNADSGTSKRVFGSFLTWLQEKTASVFVIATANDISGLPPEMMRKGRFDEIFFVDLPNRIERQTILALHLKKRLKDPAVIGEFRLDAPTMARLVDAMEGFNGAEIEQVVIAALFEAFSEQRSLRLGDLEAAITNTVPLVTTQAEQITALRRWAQARAVAASVADIVAPTAPVTPAGR
jgi:SpoVK/Ycf46/Vps4 family AAA+-type ATPase